MGCSTPIVDNYVTALGGQWHQECFKCLVCPYASSIPWCLTICLCLQDCETKFDNGSYFDYEGKPYCEPHYHDKRGTLCVTCRNPIEGRCITAMSQKYHPSCFKCSFCVKELNKGVFKKHNDKPYCHGCFDKLFAWVQPNQNYITCSPLFKPLQFKCLTYFL